jgi:DNA-binding beta-propeller fold protein YncE
VTSSPDGRYLFVAVEYGDVVAVYNLKSAVTDHFRGSNYVGSVPLGEAVVGMAVSPDGRWLYVTSELAARALHLESQGTLSVINVAEAERSPTHAVVANVPGHCSPVRVALSPDGSVIWVTARESDQLLAYSASKLRSDPAHALLAADSNRFDDAGAHSGLTVIDAAAALAQRPAILGTVPAGLFPREMALEPNGRTLLVGNFDSGQLEAVDVSALP